MTGYLADRQLAPSSLVLAGLGVLLVTFPLLGPAPCLPLQPSLALTTACLLTQVDRNNIISGGKMYNKFSFYSIVVQTVAPEGSSATEGLKDTYSFLPPKGIFFIDVSNCTCCILMTKEISTGHHREMLHWRI